VTERIEEFCRLLQFPEVQEVLKEIVRTSLVENNVFTRLNLIENHLGVDEYHCIGKDLDFEDELIEEEREPLKPISEQIAAIYAAIDSKETTVVESQTILGGNKTEMRARLLIEKLKTVPYTNGKRFMKGPEVSKWLLNEIGSEYRTTKTGARQAAKDVMEKTKELFPNSIRFNPEASGRNKKRAYNIIELIECKEM